jgi:L-iditol 2-dehydrogenase
MTVPKTMQAVVYRGVHDLRVETVPVPGIRAGELLVKVAVCGVCPTDIKKIHHGTVPPPRIFGHETAGTIVKTGAAVKGFRVGDRVALHHHVPCLKCHFCRHQAFAQCPDYKRTGITAGFEPAGGGYAEYVRVMPFVLPGVVKIPARNTFEEGAMLEPVNTVLKAVRRLALQRGDAALVIGQGPIGLMFTRLLRLSGVKVLATDLMPSRVKLAQEWGAVAFNGADSDLGDKLKKAAKCVDAVVVSVPVQAAVTRAFELVRGSGKILLFAHTRRGEASQLDLSQICVDEKDLLGSYSSDITLQAEVMRLVFSRKLDVRKLITHRFPLEKTAEAVDLASAPTERSLKVVVSQMIAK